MNINKYQPLRASSFFKLPLQLMKKKACINVKNNDEFCFKWAIISALDENVEVNHDRPSVYKISDITMETIEVNGNVLNFSNMEFPLMVKDVNIFEANNPTISVNVFGYEKNENSHKYNIIGPYYHTREEKVKHINLLYCESDDGSQSHYVYIRNISRLLRGQETNKKNRMHLCNSCLQRFSNISHLEKHKSECCKVVTIMPEEGNNVIKFKNHERKLQVPFTVYADFESILSPVSQCIPNPDIPSTTDVQQHIPCAFSYYIKCSFDDNLNKHKTSFEFKNITIRHSIKIVFFIF